MMRDTRGDNFRQGICRSSSATGGIFQNTFLTKDRSWLVKVTNTINQHWQRQNARKKTIQINGHDAESNRMVTVR